MSRRWDENYAPYVASLHLIHLLCSVCPVATRWPVLGPAVDRLYDVWATNRLRITGRCVRSYLLMRAAPGCRCTYAQWSRVSHSLYHVSGLISRRSFASVRRSYGTCSSTIALTRVIWGMIFERPLRPLGQTHVATV